MNKTWTFYLELAARLHVFFLLNVYGWGKIFGGQFYRKGHIPVEVAQKTLAETGSFDLAWTFFGHSYSYILFIGLTQIVGAWLLLWNKTKLIGTAILVPVLINIVVVDTVFEVSGAIVSACIYLFLLVLVLYFNRAQLTRALQMLTENLPAHFDNGKERLQATGAALGIFVLMFSVEQMLIHWVGY